MKTTIEIISDTEQCAHKKGDKGYVDGYVQAADNRHYAVVVCNGVFDLVPTYAMRRTGFVMESDFEVI